MHRFAADANPGEVHLCRDLNGPEALAHVLVHPDPAKGPVAPDAHVLGELGLASPTRPNDAVEAYQASPLYGHIDPDVKQRLRCVTTC